MEMVVVEEIKVDKRKEKEDKWVKWTIEFKKLLKIMLEHSSLQLRL
jgi:hypothetical protein